MRYSSNQCGCHSELQHKLSPCDACEDCLMCDSCTLYYMCVDLDIIINVCDFHSCTRLGRYSVCIVIVGLSFGSRE